MNKPSISSAKLMTIQVENLRLRSYIGFIDWEKEKLQDLIISFTFKYDAAYASMNDDVEYAVNYKSLTKDIIKIVDNQSFHLIETLAEKLYQTVINFSPNIQDVEIKVEKPYALRFSDNVLVKISSKDRYNVSLISIGSNICAEENMLKALERLQKIGIIENRTKFLQTKPLKNENQEDFLNCAVLLHTNLPFLRLKMELKQIEATMGRVRSSDKNAARIIDLDVVSFNGKILDENEIVELPFLKDFLEQLQPELFNA